MPTLSRLSFLVALACAVVWVVSLFFMDRLPPVEDIDPSLLRDPVQTPTHAKPFHIEYEGHTTSVSPQAEYELWGLVVSHNDPAAWYRFDLTHDEKSIDTRDLCVIWGANIKDADYHSVSVHNDDYTCVYRYPAGVNGFNGMQLSNNHLITDDPAIRAMIANVQIGDQIHLRGKLVNYSEDRWKGWQRSSSMTRTDEGNGACEVMFVEEMEVLSSYNRVWAALNRAALYGMWAALGLAVLLFFIVPAEPVAAQYPTRRAGTPVHSYSYQRYQPPSQPALRRSWRFAGMWMRGVAFLLDSIVLRFIGPFIVIFLVPFVPDEISEMVLSWIHALFEAYLSLALPGGAPPGFMAAVLKHASPDLGAATAALWLMNFLYAFLLVFTLGGTLGQRIMNMTVIAPGGGRAGPVRAFIRSLAEQILGVLIIAPALVNFYFDLKLDASAIGMLMLAAAVINPLVIAFSPRKRGIQDYLAGTAVVYD